MPCGSSYGSSLRRQKKLFANCNTSGKPACTAIPHEARSCTWFLVPGQEIREPGGRGGQGPSQAVFGGDKKKKMHHAQCSWTLRKAAFLAKATGSFCSWDPSYKQFCALEVDRHSRYSNRIGVLPRTWPASRAARWHPSRATEEADQPSGEIELV